MYSAKFKYIYKLLSLLKKLRHNNTCAFRGYFLRVYIYCNNFALNLINIMLLIIIFVQSSNPAWQKLTTLDTVYSTKGEVL